MIKVKRRIMKVLIGSLGMLVDGWDRSFEILLKDPSLIPSVDAKWLKIASEDPMSSSSLLPLTYG